MDSYARGADEPVALLPASRNRKEARALQPWPKRFAATALGSLALLAFTALLATHALRSNAGTAAKGRGSGEVSARGWQQGILGMAAAASCADIGCGAAYDKSFACQCNAQCTGYGSCCSDYTSTCSSAAVVTSDHSGGAKQSSYHAPAFQSQCGSMEQDIEYILAPEDTTAESFGTNMDHVPSPEMCCSMCQGVPQCKSYTWVKDALKDGCHGQCWLKGGTPQTKKHTKGVVSGVPPPRPELPSVITPAPLATSKGATVYCWSLMLPFGGEKKLIKMQWDLGVSIFACDGYGVYSNQSISIRNGGPTTHVVNTSLVVKFGGDSYTALNSWIFIAMWKKVIDEKVHEKYDWVVKVDPDAVFFVDRLRKVLAKHPTAGYINNCQYGLHGPLEVLSSSALRTLEMDYAASWDGKAPKKCVKELHFGQWGEDFFLSRCLWQVLKVTRETDTTLLCEAHCSCPDWYWCKNGTDRVSFHPFKRPDMYKQCMANALGN